jgi:hypothetical protein
MCTDGRLEPVMLVVVAEGLSFGIGRLRPVPTSPLAFAVPAFESVFRCLSHGVPFLQLSEALLCSRWSDRRPCRVGH